MLRNPHPFEVIVDYCEKHSTGVPSYLNQLERETHLKMLSPQMISGPHLGRFLSTISRIVQPLTVVEIGSFTGYATICLCSGLKDGGQVTTYEVNPETKWLFDKYIQKAQLETKIHQLMMDPLSPDHQLPENIDLAWIDADKRKNLEFFEKILANTRPGGLIMLDNTLWSGKVLEEETDVITQSIKDMNKALCQDDRVDVIMLPIRDGITLAIKK